MKKSLIIISCLVLTSCMVTRTSIGKYKELDCEPYTYSKGKQLYIFWGAVRLGKTDLSTPGSGDCEVITQRKVGDVLINTVTFGIIKSQTITIKAKNCHEKDTIKP